jgi:hypothetical protein
VAQEMILAQPKLSFFFIFAHFELSQNQALAQPISTALETTITVLAIFWAPVVLLLQRKRSPIMELPLHEY